jgi:hypothetical protein
MLGFGGRPTDANPLSNRDITALGNSAPDHRVIAKSRFTPLDTMD